MSVSFLKSRCYKKISMMNLIKRGFSLLCLTGFVYQTKCLFDQYVNGKTIINLEIDLVRNYSMPALTICPGGLDLVKLSKLDLSYNQEYKQFLKLTDKIKFGVINDTVSQAMASMNANLTMNLVSMVNNAAINSVDILRMYTVDDQNIEIDMVLATLSDSEYLDRFNEIVQDHSYRPLERMFLYPNNRVLKCFTYFSELDPFWKAVRLDSFKLLIKVLLNTSINYYTTRSEIAIAYHSPNIVPQESAFKFVNPGKGYLLSFNQLKIEKLSDRYVIG